eukprot:762439-Hanusia_phi.AAC.2
MAECDQLEDSKLLESLQLDDNGSPRRCPGDGGCHGDVTETKELAEELADGVTDTEKRRDKRRRSGRDDGVDGGSMEMPMLLLMLMLRI